MGDTQDKADDVKSRCVHDHGLAVAEFETRFRTRADGIDTAIHPDRLRAGKLFGASTSRTIRGVEMSRAGTKVTLNRTL